MFGRTSSVSYSYIYITLGVVGGAPSQVVYKSPVYIHGRVLLAEIIAILRTSSTTEIQTLCGQWKSASAPHSVRMMMMMQLESE